jgi:hypothetical protein
MAQIGLGSAALMLLLCLAVLIAGASESRSEAGLVGSRAAEFRLRDLDHRMVSLSDHRGEVMVLAFVQSDSPELRQLSPRLGTLVRQWSQQGVHFSLVFHEPDGRSAVPLLRIELARLGLEVSALLDSTGEVLRDYRAQPMPLIVVIDRNGVIRYRGPLDAPSAETTDCPQTVQALLAEIP